MGTKVCTDCGEEKSRRWFNRDRRCTGGRRSQCKTCHRAASQRYRLDDLNKAARNWKRWRRDNPKRYILWRAKQHAKAAGRKFSLTEADLTLPKYCPVLGLKLKYHNAKKYDHAAASLDRVDNRKGYISGNVLVVSYRANMLKRDATWQELLRVVDFYRRRDGAER